MRSIWKGSVSFGLVNIPVKLYSATGDHDLRFHQVHKADGGRIRYKRTCEQCGLEVTYSDIVKGYESEDGRLVMITPEDLDSLPVASGHEIDVMEFVPAEQVDPMLMDKSYYLEPDGKAAKPYALLREALSSTDRMAVVKVALRQRETLAVLRVRDKVIVLQTLLWADEIRSADLKGLADDVDLRPQEVTMAQSLVESLAADFEPEQYEDEYKAAMQHLVEAKLEGEDSHELLAPETAESDSEADVVDLVAALRKSVESAKSKRTADKAAEKPARAAAQSADEDGDAPSSDAALAEAANGASSGGRAPAKKPTKSAAAKEPAKETAAKKSTAKRKTPAKKSA
jgi:DNA end-binding protein Ku